MNLGDGGAMYLERAHRSQIVGCKFENNLASRDKAGNRGALYVSGDQWFADGQGIFQRGWTNDFEVSQCLFTDNRASQNADGGGGAVYFSRVKRPKITGSEFFRNIPAELTADICEGGAMRLVVTPGFILENNIIAKGAARDGAALFLRTISPEDPDGVGILRHNTIADHATTAITVVRVNDTFAEARYTAGTQNKVEYILFQVQDVEFMVGDDIHVLDGWIAFRSCVRSSASMWRILI